jgi:hypothetical protein
MSQVPKPVEDVVRNLTDGGPRGRKYSLSASTSGRGDGTGTFRLTLLPRACREAGHTLRDPGTVEEYYFSDEQMLVVDLNPEGHHERQ